MKTIGLLGGMSWESTESYYRAINEGVRDSLGGLHSAQIVMVSVDFDPIEKLQMAGDWDGAGDILLKAALQLEGVGVDAVMICTNTMHKVAPKIEQHLTVPLLHIADATGSVVATAGYCKVALLGTAFTMEQDFYTARLIQSCGVEVLVPSDASRKIVHRVIYDELCLGEINPESKQQYLAIIDQLARDGAEAVILGCTEIGLLVQQADAAVPLLNTTEIHAQAAIDFLLA